MQWHQLDHMQTICTSLQTNNHINTLILIFTGRMLFLTPNQQCRSTEGRFALHININSFQYMSVSNTPDFVHKQMESANLYHKSRHLQNKVSSHTRSPELNAQLNTNTTINATESFCLIDLLVV